VSHRSGELILSDNVLPAHSDAAYTLGFMDTTDQQAERIAAASPRHL
jgi:hypothetical protein